MRNLTRVLILPMLGSLSLVIAQASPPAVEWVPGADVAKRATSNKGPWLALLERLTMTVGRYRLVKGQVDEQSPHPRDEVYYVIAGKAKLEAGGQTRAVQAGDTAFVSANTPHHFLDIEEDLDVLVFFSSARATTGGMAAAAAPPTEQTPYPETSQRGNARIFYWFGPNSAGQVSIDFGQPAWRPGFAKFLDQSKGQRWRFGENFWTTIDTNMPLRLGGIDVPIGSYYAVLQSTPEAGVQLVLLDPQEVRKRRLDAYEAGKTTGGIVVPLTRSEAPLVGRLEIELTVDAAQRDAGRLLVRFGPTELSVPLQMVPQRD